MRSVFSSESIKKNLATNSVSCDPLPVTNSTTTATKTEIIVRDKKGKRVNSYCPNKLGRSFAELYMLAKQEANKIGGYVTV